MPQELAGTCPELTELDRLVRAFAELLTPAAGNDAKLAAWLTDARTGFDLLRHRILLR
ncbi:hypothetical protein [Microbispora sp. ATCC PTA-5024]|uniref:hypothetical protein n=1 Tax=Microbispora sp. ATCC PTA-5024 TaxID=316330 RepID=UPI0003DD9A08|nr:hypothetical protein [Microbispora sp. ATCC PTA-5024]ETK32805.1 hypothetical protein MPTA5024_27820 [Microbispora sp. ATCC PTA-5024]